VEAIRRAQPDLLVSWFWTTKVPRQILQIAPGLGIHPSLLPRYRGADPYFWAIDSGDTFTGVTAHRLDAEYDTGAILARRELSIAPGWNAWQLARALDRPGLDLLRQIVRAYAGGTPPESAPQDERAATLAPSPSDDELAVRWAWPAVRIERRVRAAAPWPGAWTQVGERFLTLVRVRATAEFPRALAAGEAAVRSDGVAVVRAGDTAVELLEARLDEDERVLTQAELARLVAETRG
jgi:methionyl-tRNA formyltransferase